MLLAFRLIMACFSRQFAGYTVPILYNAWVNKGSFIIIALAALAAGCGGGASGPTASAGSQNNNFGPFQTRASGGKPQVGIASNTIATVTSVAGTAFTKITYAPAPVPGSTRIAMTRQAELYNSIYMMRSDGSAAHILGGINLAVSPIAWSRDGRIAFARINLATQKYELWMCNADGTNLHKIFTDTVSDYNPAWGPDNFHILFTRNDPIVGQAQIYSITSSGGSLTHISDGTAADDDATWTPDGSTIYFERFNSITTTWNLWKMSATGATPTLVIDGQGVLTYGRIAIAPQGNALVVSENNRAALAYAPLPYVAGSTFMASAPNQFYDLGNFSPDGGKVLFGSYNSGTGFAELDVANADGHDVQSIFSHSDSSLAIGFWEPYPVPIPYVSSTGGSVFGTSSSGFLYGMIGPSFASVLSFTATTPATATAVADPVAPGAISIVYKLSADAITSIKYVNDFGGALNSVSLAASTKSAIVSFDGGTGFVSAVVPVAAKRAPVITKRGQNTTLTGNFTAVFDAHARNLAPNGASEVVIGKAGVVSIR